MVVLLHGDEGAPGEIDAVGWARGVATEDDRLRAAVPDRARVPVGGRRRRIDEQLVGLAAGTRAVTAMRGWAIRSRGSSPPIRSTGDGCTSSAGQAEPTTWAGTRSSTAPLLPASPLSRAACRTIPPARPRGFAGYFLLGSADPRYQSGQPVAVKSILARCGGATRLVVLPGLDHPGRCSPSPTPATPPGCSTGSPSTDRRAPAEIRRLRNARPCRRPRWRSCRRRRRRSASG